MGDGYLEFCELINRIINEDRVEWRNVAPTITTRRKLHNRRCSDLKVVKSAAGQNDAAGTTHKLQKTLLLLLLLLLYMHRLE